MWGLAAANYANSIIWDTENPDYSKALEICLNDIKNSAGATSCIGYVGFFYQEGHVYDVDFFNAYVLYEFDPNLMTSLNTDSEGK